MSLTTINVHGSTPEQWAKLASTHVVTTALNDTTNRWIDMRLGNVLLTVFAPKENDDA